MQGGATAELNAMVPGQLGPWLSWLVPSCGYFDAGQEVEAVFGFCSIRNFTDATDVLKEKVRGSSGCRFSQEWDSQCESSPGDGLRQPGQ